MICISFFKSTLIENIVYREVKETFENFVTRSKNGNAPAQLACYGLGKLLILSA